MSNLKRAMVGVAASLVALGTLVHCVGDAGTGGGGETDAGADANGTGTTDGAVDTDTGGGGGDGGVDSAVVDADLPPAADGSVEWVSSYAADPQAGAATDQQGNTIVTGTIRPTPVPFDDAGSAVSSGGNDVLIVKLDAKGKAMWTKTFGTVAGNEFTRQVAVDLAGDAYICGTFSGATFQLGALPAITNAGAQSGFVAKVSGVDGHAIWAKAFGTDTGAQTASCKAVATDGTRVAVGATFVGAHFAYEATGGTPTLIANSDSATQDMAIVMLDAATGQGFWANGIGGVGSDDVNSVALTATGDILIAATPHAPSFKDTAGSITSAIVKKGAAGKGNALFARLAKANGKIGTPYVFGANTANGTGDVNGYGIGQTKTGKLVAVGSFSGTVEFVPGSAVVVPVGVDGVNIDDHDGFILQIDDQGAGTIGGVLQIGGTGDDIASVVAVDRFGQYVVSGTHKSTNTSIAAVPIKSPAVVQTISDGNSFFMAKFTPAGTLLWARGVTSASKSDAIYPTGLSVGPRGETRAAFLLQGTTDFGDGNLVTSIPNAFSPSEVVVGWNP